MKLIVEKSTLIIVHNQNVIIKHTDEKPFIYLGIGKETIKQHYGDFKIKDKVVEKIPMKLEAVQGNIIKFSNCGYYISMKVSLMNHGLTIESFEMDARANRIYFMLKSRENERFFGCGEQFSYLNLKGRNFPIWTSEPGVGRDRSTLITFQAEQSGIGGGDYYTSNFPQPTFISDQKYLFHLDTSFYSDFDFSESEETQITVWGLPKGITIDTGKTFLDLMGTVKKKFGTQPKLPDWVLGGITLGIQGGTNTVYEKIRVAKEFGININAVWCQDWVGKKITSFGKRLFWKWEKDEQTYPEFEKLIEDLERDGIQFMAYINPYLLEGTDLFNYASNHNYFVKRPSGIDYIADFGEFNCGTIDFTNPNAMKWYKNIIINNIINLGIKGWMADFGEYVPVDAVFYNGKTGFEMHNQYPVLWAKCNYEAVQDSGNLGKVFYFMRAGGVGSAKYSTMMWAGDQSVDFTIHDGLASTIPAAISLGLMGNGLTHFDIGGYTSLFGNVRTEELMLRYLEYSVFTPYMRTHEGNRPNENFQYDQSENCLRQFAIFSKLRKALFLYIRHVVEENAVSGLPAVRPLFLHYDEEECLDIVYEYLFGRDLLVAPVYRENISEWEVFLPNDEWIHLLSKKHYQGGHHKVQAELGNIPVFYRKCSEFASLFENIKK